VRTLTKRPSEDWFNSTVFTDASFQELLTCCTQASYATNPKFEMAKRRAASWLVSIALPKILTTLPTGVSILTMIEPGIVSEESTNYFSKNSPRWERRSTKMPRLQNAWGLPCLDREFSCESPLHKLQITSACIYST